MIYETAFGDNVIFVDEVTSSTKIGELVDVIQLSDSIDSHRNNVSLDDRVTFLDAVAVNGGGIHIVTLTDEVSFDDFVTPRPLTVFGDYLYIYDWLEIPNGILNDELVFVDEITGVSGPGITDTITLEDSLDYKWIGLLVSTDTVTLTDGFSGFVNDWRVVVFPIVEERP